MTIFTLYYYDFHTGDYKFVDHPTIGEALISYKNRVLMLESDPKVDIVSAWIDAKENGIAVQSLPI